LPGEAYITASCLISNNTVYKNGAPVFVNKGMEAPAFLIAVYQHFEIKYPKFYKMDNLSKLGWLANEVLLWENGLKEQYEPGRIGIVLSNANASLDTDVRYYETTKEFASPALFVYTLPNIVIGEICIRHHFKGENAFFISEQFDAGFIKQYVTNLFNNDILQACICGWVEFLGDRYKTVLFLVEKNDGLQGEPFTKENLNKIYELENG
jgi:hypothetical protein